jgi:peptidoglycan hydrolase-like protein with peptidoglycan-binding domain
MLHLLCAMRARTVIWLAVLVAIPAMPGAAAAQDPGAGPGLSPRLLADASWHGRPIQRPLPRRSDIADHAATLRPGTGFRRPGGSRRVRDLQRRLTRLGYRPGASDGLFGPRTQAAVLAFQRKHGLDRTGAAGSATLRLLRRRSAAGATDEPAQPAGSAPAGSTPARPAPPAPANQVAPATPASDSGGLPLPTVVILVVLALPLLMIASELVRRRRNSRDLLPGLQPLLLDRPDREPWMRLPQAPRVQMPEDEVPATPSRKEPPPPVEPIPAPEPASAPEPTPAREPAPKPEAGEPPRIMRRQPPIQGSPLERRIALRARILAMRAEGMTVQQIADQLTEEGEATLGGNRSWQPWNVRAATRPTGPSDRTPTQGRRGST